MWLKPLYLWQAVLSRYSMEIGIFMVEVPVYFFTELRKTNFACHSSAASLDTGYTKNMLSQTIQSVCSKLRLLLNVTWSDSDWSRGWVWFHLECSRLAARTRIFFYWRIIETQSDAVLVIAYTDICSATDSSRWVTGYWSLILACHASSLCILLADIIWDVARMYAHARYQMVF